jgi:hypothetical protein
MKGLRQEKPPICRAKIVGEQRELATQSALCLDGFRIERQCVVEEIYGLSVDGVVTETGFQRIAW